jgi:hypothetical protein
MEAADIYLEQAASLRRFCLHNFDCIVHSNGAVYLNYIAKERKENRVAIDVKLRDIDKKDRLEVNGLKEYLSDKIF